MDVAKDFPEYTFAIANEDDYVSELKDLGLSESGEEVNVAILDTNGKKYAKVPEEFDSDSLRDFVMAFKKGKLLKCNFTATSNCVPLNGGYKGQKTPRRTMG